MDNVLLFAGTTEGRQIAEACRGKDLTLTVCVATEYGETMIEPADNLRVLSGRKDASQIEALLAGTGAKLLIDATHPYAAHVTGTLRAVCEKTGTEYLRVLRRSEHEGEDSCVFVDDTDAAVAWLRNTEGRVLLTVGSKELGRYTALPDWKDRIFARILPMPESTRTAFDLGFEGRQLICMQGPFTEEMNTAMLRMLDIRYLVTKDTGAAGGYADKIRGALACGVIPVVVRRPLTEEGVSVAECLADLERRFGLTLQRPKEITILGVGMGSEGTLTLAAEKACRAAELIVGAKRVTEALERFQKPVRCAVLAQEIEEIVRNAPCERIVVAMSGDTGFYSGTKGLLKRIGDLRPAVLPGISSIVYFSSRTGVSWDDAVLLSAHGRSCNVVSKIRRSEKAFVLSGGETGVRDLLTALCENGLGDVRVTVGENLSYPEERITSGTAAELSSRSFDSLALVLIQNPRGRDAVTVHGRPDEDFLRSKVPMTKSEVRAVTLSKLRLTANAVCWDVGAGTGSVSLEMAECCEDGQVYAVERNEEACDLIEQNKKHLGVTNVTVIRGTAPESLADLPAPTHVFIGGSGGTLRQIMELALEKNPRVRLVLNTVTAETFAEAVGTLRTLPVGDPEIVELNVSRGRKAGAYHLMTAQNPVYIISCQGGTGDE